MGTTAVWGSTDASHGTCYTIPLDPINSEGACVLTTGIDTTIDVNYVASDTSNTIVACKAACQKKGTECIAYQFHQTTCKLFNLGTKTVKGNAKYTTGKCYRDQNQFIGDCKKKTGNAQISDSAQVITKDSSVSTLTLCKNACKSDSKCTAYHFYDTSCKIYKTGTTALWGSNDASHGTCYTIPIDPVNSEGACVLAGGGAIDVNYVASDGSNTV